MKNPRTFPTFLYLGMEKVATCGQSNGQTLKAADDCLELDMALYKTDTGPFKTWLCGVSSKENLRKG